MWLWPSVPVILSLTLGYGAPVSMGPTSNEEGKILWEKGQEAIRKDHFQEAVNHLQRFVARYPGHTGYLQAHLLLAQALIATGHSKEAIPLLSSFISTTGTYEGSANARLELGSAYLSLHLFNEAYLVGLEIDKMIKRNPLSSDIQLGSHLLKAQAALGSNRKIEAEFFLDTVRQQLSHKNSPKLFALLYQQELQLKTSDCARLPSKGALDESQIRDQLDRRGTCLLEALLTFRKLLQTGVFPMAERGAVEINEAFASYTRVCWHPPTLTSPIKRSRTTKEKREAQLELTDLLLSQCKKTSETALSLITSWKNDLPTTGSVALTLVSNQLKKTFSRTP